MEDIVVPEIPEEIRNKEFSASDIKWVKTVNDENTFSAYIPPDKPYRRPRKNSAGICFCLQLNEIFTDSLNSVPKGDLILLYQTLKDSSNNQVKCLTHLVTPIGDRVIPNPYPYDGGPGRWVQVIAMTKDNVVSSIRFENTVWPTIGFRGNAYSNLTFQNGRIYKINSEDQYLSDEQLSKLQNDIWKRFDYFKKGNLFSNRLVTEQVLQNVEHFAAF